MIFGKIKLGRFIVEKYNTQVENTLEININFHILYATVNDC